MFRTTVFAALTGVAVAHATPLSLTHQIRALDADGAPVDGARPITVSLWSDDDSVATQDRLWEHATTTSFTDGYAALVLDTNGTEAVQAEWFTGDVWLEVSVDGLALSPRTRLTQVPRAGTVASANGQVYTAPGGAFAMNLYPTTWQATVTRYTGNVDYTDSQGRVWAGRPATTAICQDLMGEGARLCSASDITRLIAAGAVNAHGQSFPDRLTMPSACDPTCWISSEGGTDLYPSGPPYHIYSDCRQFMSGSGDDRGPRVDRPSNTGTSFWPVVLTASCASSYELLCCR